MYPYGTVALFRSGRWDESSFCCDAWQSRRGRASIRGVILTSPNDQWQQQIFPG